MGDWQLHTTYIPLIYCQLGDYTDHLYQLLREPGFTPLGVHGVHLLENAYLAISANNLDVLKELCSPRHAGYRLPQVKGMTGPPKKKHTNLTSPQVWYIWISKPIPCVHGILTDP